MAYNEDKNAALSEEKEFYDGLLESEKRYYEESKRLEEENERIKEQNRRREYEKRLASAKNAVNAEIIKQNEILRRKKLADEEYLDQLKKTAEAERLALEEVKDNIRTIYADIADYAEESLENVVRAQENMEKKLSKVGQLARKQIIKGWEYENGGADMEFVIAANIEPQIKLLTKYKDALEDIKKRIYSGGVSAQTAKDFFMAIGELGVYEGIEVAQNLMQMSDERFSQYLSKWEEREKLTDEITKSIYGEEFKTSVDDARDYMVKALTDAGLEIPEGFTISGSLSAEKFGTAFIEELHEQMEKVYEIMDSFAFSVAPEAVSGAAISSVSYNNATTTYILKGSGETVAKQLQSARNHSELERMRNDS